MRLSKPLVQLVATIALGGALLGSPAVAATQTFSSRADGFVDASRPSANYDSARALRVDERPKQRAYVRFRVGDLRAPLESATLDLFVTRGSARSIRVRRVGNTWRESSLTWRRRPHMLHAATTYARRVREGTWVSIDVSSLVRGRGVYSFEVAARTRTTVSFASREADSARQTRRVLTTNANHGPKLRWTTATPPANTTPPSITGTPENGRTLTADPGTWSGSTTMSYGYRWQRCAADSCNDVPGATASSYALDGDDLGFAIRVLVTALNSAGSTSAESAPTTDVSPGPTLPPTVAITSAPMAATTSTSATLAWTTSGAVESTECQLDGSAFEPCSSPASHASLAVGPHSFAVRVTNAAGATTDTASWNVTAPTLTWIPASGATCTIYVAPTCSSTSAGATSSTRTTIRHAMNIVAPGSVVCIDEGTYNLASPLYPSRSGTDTAWITYRAYNGQPTFVYTGSTAVGGGLIQVSGGTAWAGAHHLIFDGLKVDASNLLGSALRAAKGSHHVVFRNNVVVNGGASGIAANGVDYIAIEDNQVYHCGYNQGWASGIVVWFQSYGGATAWYDTADTFHFVIARNLVSGTFDNSPNRSDGNGMIVDGKDSVPPILFVGNVVYQNGGRGFTDYGNSGRVYLVNNTFLENGLDLSIAGGHAADVAANCAANTRWVNNLAFGRAEVGSYATGYTYRTDSSTVSLGRNLAWSGSIVNLPPSSFLEADPQFVSRPALPTGSAPWASALPPWQLGERLSLLAGSPIDTGSDATQDDWLTAQEADVLRAEYAVDVAGKARVQGSTVDLGAYESVS